jgi:hypothetical protein
MMPALTAGIGVYEGKALTGRKEVERMTMMMMMILVVVMVRVYVVGVGDTSSSATFRLSHSSSFPPHTASSRCRLS